MFGARPKQTAKAKILADEGNSIARDSTQYALRYQKYIVEVHPNDAPAFRAEVEAWVRWMGGPNVGDILNVEYTPGSAKVELCIKGDPRYDWELRAESEKTAAAATREALLNGPVPQEPLADPPLGDTGLDDREAELFAKIDRLRKDSAADAQG
jgi:hypothetical protein